MGVVSAPVMHGDTHEQGVVGLIDTLDILTYIVELFGENDSKNHHVNIFDRLENGGKLAREKIVSITDFAHNPYTPYVAQHEFFPIGPSPDTHTHTRIYKQNTKGKKCL